VTIFVSFGVEERERKEGRRKTKKTFHLNSTPMYLLKVNEQCAWLDSAIVRFSPDIRQH
jgi:hypothetical protein